jgi:hypothetical protein
VGPPFRDVLPRRRIDDERAPVEVSDEEERTVFANCVDRVAEGSGSRSVVEAGLDLPRITVQFLGEDLALCDGAQARAHVVEGEVVLRVCWYDRFVLLHELGHVWEAQNVPVESHQQFMGLRDGVEAWSSVDVSWDARGREHAANVIAWGLLDDPYPISRTYPNDVVSMIDAFTFLTSVAPLHDGGAGIQHPDRSLFDGRQNEPLESGR